MVVRRSCAALLVLAAVISFAADRRQAPGTAVVAAARDLRPGMPLRPDDVLLVRIRPALLPDGALRLTADVRGRTVTGAVRRGEIVTDTRLLGPRLPRRLTGDPGARLVPVHLADAGTAALLESGDVVDVLTKGGTAEPPAVVATNAVVALAAGTAANRRGGESAAPVLLAMSAAAAHRVAAASLTTALTVVIH